MWCKECNHYINGFRARVQHQIEHNCLGFTHFFIVAYIEERRPKQKWKNGRRYK